mgnify:FL=1
MQSLDVISINIWQILISLCNLLILFLIVKKFLFKPVRNMLAKREEEIGAQYEKAAEAEKTANEHRDEWEKKLAGAKADAGRIVDNATKQAEYRSGRIVADAKEKADSIVRQAQSQAALEQKKAQSEIKKEIVDVSTVLTEKMLHREINADDHRTIIDSVIAEMGENDD